MTEQAEGRTMRELRAIVAKNLALFERLSDAWDGLTDEQQQALVDDAETTVSENEEAGI